MHGLKPVSRMEDLNYVQHLIEVFFFSAHSMINFVLKFGVGLVLYFVIGALSGHASRMKRDNKPQK